MSKIEVNTIEPQSGTTVTVGASGDTITIPSGATLDASNATTTLPANVVTTDGTQTLTNKSIVATQLTGTITPSDGTVTTAKLADSSVSLAKLTATGTQDATTFLRGDNTFAVPAGGTNTPTFLAYRSSNQSLSDAVITKVQLDTEEFDSDSCFDNATNYRFTPTTAGKYFLFGTAFVGGSTATTTEYNVYIQKNGSSIASTAVDRRTSGLGYNNQFLVSTVSSANGSTDYFELYVVMVGGGTKNIIAGITNTYFGAYKIIE